jgi:RNA-directed DNA polymerase
VCATAAACWISWRPAQAALNQRTWRPSRARVFVTTRPKAREIHAPTFSDRVVHHLLVPQFEALFEPIFIHASYANRAGKGTHAAVARLQTFMRQATRNGQVRAYALQFDVANCFNSINRRLLYGFISKRLNAASRTNPAERERRLHLAWLTRQLLTGNPGLGAQRLGAPSRFDRVPIHKRLANAAPECGLPIGNLSSQFFANVHLDPLDQFVKHTLKCRWYVRYVDDFVLLASDANQLMEWRVAVRDFLKDRLRLALRLPEPEPAPVSAGVDFVGYVVRPGYLLSRRRVVQAADRALMRWKARVLTAEGMHLSAKSRAGLRSTLGSYLGHFRHASSRNLAAGLWQRHPWLHAVFSLAWPDVVSRFQAAIATSLAGQRSWFVAQFPEAAVWLQVGANWECYDRDAHAMARRYGLRLAASPRPGFAATLVLPAFSWARWQTIFSRDGVAVVAAEQAGCVRGHRHGLKKRALSYLSPAVLNSWAQ